jgi:hypothetical protein
MIFWLTSWFCMGKGFTTFLCTCAEVQMFMFYWQRKCRMKCKWCVQVWPVDMSIFGAGPEGVKQGLPAAQHLIGFGPYFRCLLSAKLVTVGAESSWTNVSFLILIPLPQSHRCGRLKTLVIWWWSASPN